MSTILEALRRLQADREEQVPPRDLREVLAEPLGKERRVRSRKRGVGMGAISALGGVSLGAALGFWIFSARAVESWSLPNLGFLSGLVSMAESDAGAAEADPVPPTSEPSAPPEPGQLPQAGVPIAESTKSESRPVAAEGVQPEDSPAIRDFDPSGGAAQDSPRVSSSAPAQSADGERPVRPVAGNDAAAAVDPGSAAATAPGAPSVPSTPPSSAPRSSTPRSSTPPSSGQARGFSAIAKPGSRKPSERAAATAPASSSPAATPANSPSKSGVYVTPQTPPPPSEPAPPAVAPKPPTRAARQGPPRRAPKPPAPAVPVPPTGLPDGGAPGNGLEDPLPFPELAVANVRWHPDPKRREASVEVDGAVAINAREGDLVGGALLSRISPGEVEFRVGPRSKIVPVGR